MLVLPPWAEAQGFTPPLLRSAEKRLRSEHVRNSLGQQKTGKVQKKEPGSFFCTFSARGVAYRGVPMSRTLRDWPEAAEKRGVPFWG